jgi:hypothetical protein
MKRRLSAKLLAIALLTVGLNAGCAESPKKEAAEPASKASPEATAAIANATGAIEMAKANDWIWRDTEQFLKEAQAAADAGDNTTAIKLANKAKYQAEAAVIQYNHEKNNPRGL